MSVTVNKHQRLKVHGDCEQKLQFKKADHNVEENVDDTTRRIISERKEAAMVRLLDRFGNFIGELLGATNFADIQAERESKPLKEVESFVDDGCLNNKSQEARELSQPNPNLRAPNDASIVIQRVVRFKQAVSKVGRIRCSTQRQHISAGALLRWAVVTIQRIGRGRLSRKKSKAQHTLHEVCVYIAFTMLIARIISAIMLFGLFAV